MQSHGDDGTFNYYYYRWYTQAGFTGNSGIGGACVHGAKFGLGDRVCTSATEIAARTITDDATVTAFAALGMI